MKKRETAIYSKDFPRNINGYKYKKILPAKNFNSYFNFAIYEDDSGKEYVCKLWTQKSGKLKKESLKNEIKDYELLNKLSKNPSFLPDVVSFPEMVASYVTERMVFFLVEKVHGKLLASNEVSTIYKKYSDVHNYLTTMSLHQMGKPLIVVRSNMKLFVLFHIYLCIIFLNSPKVSIFFIKQLVNVYKGFYLGSKNKELTLVLRDLASEANFFTTGNKTKVIDLESLAWAPEIFKYSCMLMVECNNKKFIKYALSTLKKTKLESRRNREIFKAYLTYCGLAEYIFTYRLNKNVVFEDIKYAINNANFI